MNPCFGFAGYLHSEDELFDSCRVEKSKRKLKVVDGVYRIAERVYRSVVSEVGTCRPLFPKKTIFLLKKEGKNGRFIAFQFIKLFNIRKGLSSVSGLIPSLFRHAFGGCC